MSIFRSLFGARCDMCGQKVSGQTRSLPGVLGAAGSRLCDSCYEKAERDRQEEARRQSGSPGTVGSAAKTNAASTGNKSAALIEVKLGHARQMTCSTCNNQAKHELAIMTRDGQQETLWRCSLCGAYHS
jgi:NAD-dependent SIR2 family protein deacetylase